MKRRRRWFFLWLLINSFLAGAEPTAKPGAAEAADLPQEPKVVEADDEDSFRKFQRAQLDEKLPLVPLKMAVYGSIFQTAYYFIDLNVGAPSPQSLSLEIKPRHFTREIDSCESSTKSLRIAVISMRVGRPCTHYRRRKILYISQIYRYERFASLNIYVSYEWVLTPKRV